MLIAIEGVDGSGKTTIGKALADRLSFSFVEKSLMNASGLSKAEYIKMREYLKKCTVASDQLMALFFGMNNILCSSMGRKMDIVADRYIATSFFWYGNEDTMPLYDSLAKMISAPMLTVVLNVPSSVAIERVKQRNFKTSDERDKEILKAQRAGEFANKVIPFLERHGYNYVVIENQNSIEQVVDSIVYLLHKA